MNPVAYVNKTNIKCVRGNVLYIQKCKGEGGNKDDFFSVKNISFKGGNCMKNGHKYKQFLSL